MNGQQSPFLRSIPAAAIQRCTMDLQGTSRTRSKGWYQLSSQHTKHTEVKKIFLCWWWCFGRTDWMELGVSWIMRSLYSYARTACVFEWMCWILYVQLTGLQMTRCFISVQLVLFGKLTLWTFFVNASLSCACMYVCQTDDASWLTTLTRPSTSVRPDSC